MIGNRISGYLYNEIFSESNEEKCTTFQSMTWSLIAHKNTIKNCSSALQACFFRSVSLCITSSHQRCFVKKDVLINFAKFAGKHLCQSLFFNKVAGLEFCETSKNNFSTLHLQTNGSVASFIYFFIKTRILLQFLRLVFINALITST